MLTKKLTVFSIYLSISFLICIRAEVLQAQPLTFQQASFSLPYSMAGIGDLTAYVPQQTSIYIFGGYTRELGYSNKIVEVNLSTEQVSVLNTTMPFSGVDLAVAFNSTDGKVYIFRYHNIYFFDPISKALSLVASNILPESVGDYSTPKYVPTQDAVYIFGYRGSARGNFTLRYNVSSQTVQQLTDIPRPRNNGGYSVAYCPINDAVYLFGGNHSSSYYDLIQRFDLLSTSYVTLSETLPSVNSAAAAIYVPEEDAIYSIGGSTNSIILDDVYKYVCSSETIQQMPDLPVPRASHGVEYVPVQHRIYLLGGVNTQTWGYGSATDTIYYLSFNSPPVANCQDIPVSVDHSCQANVTTDQVNNGSYDPDGDPVTLTLSPPGPYPIGSTIVTLTVIDNRGGSDQCTATVTVVDDEAPTIACPSPTTASADANCQALIPDLTGSVAASDNCTASNALTISQSPAAGIAVSLGSHTIMYLRIQALHQIPL